MERGVRKALDDTPFFTKVQTSNVPLFIKNQIEVAQAEFAELRERYRYPNLIRDWDKATALMHSKFSNVGSFLCLPKSACTQFAASYATTTALCGPSPTRSA